MKKYTHKQSLQSGFTLVELLVSLSLFTVIVLAAVGSLYTVNQASVKVNAMRTVLDNLNFATESLSRTIRTGENIVCNGPGVQIGGSSCAMGTTSGSDHLSLDSTIGGNKAIQYRWVKIGGKGTIQRCGVNGASLTGTLNSASCVSLTAPEIDIQRMTFFVDGADANDSKQPGVMILMQGVADAGHGNIAPFAVQTYVSQRAGE